jgi:general secretion pathway protein M
MTGQPNFKSSLARHPAVAVALYLALTGSFLLVAVERIVQVNDRRASVAAAGDLLEQMNARAALQAQPVAKKDAAQPDGPPFLEGGSLSIAGAALLQRVSGAIAKDDGSILSSQLELQGAEAKAGSITMTASFEIAPDALQPLLYDLEAGMPFLFIDQVAVQGPANAGGTDRSRLRVVLSVSGQWRGLP